MSRGPKKSGFNPVKEYFRCPVKNCNSEFRGDEISRHFTKNANLDLLREALENLNKKYKCVLCEKFNKLFCYCKINR